ncbi:unnamed protein product [Arabidopsis lyrata]|nr:unnamed protein product [Arabidopsis lyrata]
MEMNGAFGERLSAKASHAYHTSVLSWILMYKLFLDIFVFYF